MLRAIGAPSMFAAAAQGLASGQARFSAASERALASPDLAVTPAALVDQKLAETQIMAAAKVIRVADELTGTLIDTLA